MLVERLEAAPWYVQRNLLALLSSLPEIPAEFSLEPYSNHDDARVRREALKLQCASRGSGATRSIPCSANRTTSIYVLG
jgi:hypothetical protein